MKVGNNGYRFLAGKSGLGRMFTGFIQQLSEEWATKTRHGPE